jgi:hypothetical protein
VKGWIEATWDLSEKGKRASYYNLTRAKGGSSFLTSNLSGMRSPAPWVCCRWTFMTANFRKLRWLFARRRRDPELDQELASHLEEEMQEREYHAARRELGNIGLIKEDTRAMWGCT